MAQAVMVQAVKLRLKSVRPQKSESLKQLWVVPIKGESHDEPDYRLLEDDVLDKVKVTEVDESGQVPTLRVSNKLDAMVYLMDGQELVGAKQNRILNTDVLVAAKQTLEVPVSCVERGRWGYRQRNFTPGKSGSISMRSRKNERVYESLKRSARHDADQAKVWEDVDESIACAKAFSPTHALNDAYSQRQAELNAARRDLKLPDDAVGIAVFHGEQFLGLDLFDRHETLGYFWNSLLDSYVIERLRIAPGQEDKADSPGTDNVKLVLEQAGAAAWERFDSPGEGDDYRLEHETLSGSSLVWQDKVAIHLQLFPKATSGEDDRRDTRRPRVRRPYLGPQ